MMTFNQVLLLIAVFRIIEEILSPLLKELFYKFFG